MVNFCTNLECDICVTALAALFEKCKGFPFNTTITLCTHFFVIENVPS